MKKQFTRLERVVIIAQSMAILWAISLAVYGTLILLLLHGIDLAPWPVVKGAGLALLGVFTALLVVQWARDLFFYRTVRSKMKAMYGI